MLGWGLMVFCMSLATVLLLTLLLTAHLLLLGVVFTMFLRGSFTGGVLGGEGKARA